MFWTDIARFLQYFWNLFNSFINIFAILKDFNGIFSKYSFNITVLCGILPPVTLAYFQKSKNALKKGIPPAITSFWQRGINSTRIFQKKRGRSRLIIDSGVWKNASNVVESILKDSMYTAQYFKNLSRIRTR